MDNKIANYHHSHDLQRTLQDMDSKITKILMDSGADSMIPNIANKESAFHYCGQSGNAAVRKQQFLDKSWEEVSFVLRPSCAFAGGQRDHQVPPRWPDPTSGQQAVRVSVIFCISWRNFFATHSFSLEEEIRAF